MLEGVMLLIGIAAYLGLLWTWWYVTEGRSQG